MCCLLLDFSGSGRVQQRVKNEAFGTLFQLGTWQILKIDTLRIKKNQVALKKPGGARGPLFPSRLKFMEIMKESV